MTDAELLRGIETRVRNTICDTFSPDRGHTVEGRISKDDFDALLDLVGRIAAVERERCAMIHANIDPASDEERRVGAPGAGAMGAVLEYRDAIRAG